MTDHNINNYAKLRQFIDSIFEEAPQTKKTVELKEEMIVNLTDKYNDLIKEGKSEEAAYNIAVASIGDVSELIRSLQEKNTPVFNGYNIHYSKEEIERKNQKSALLFSVAVALYIISIIPVMIFNSINGVICMFTIVALATGTIIYNKMTKLKYIKTDDTIVEEFKEWQNSTSDKRKLRNSIIAAAWAFILTLYLIISIITFSWHITWIIFLLGSAITQIIKAFFDLK